MPSKSWWLRSTVPLIVTISTSAGPSFVYDTGRALISRQQPSVSVTANCSSAFSWMNNGKGQSPCVVAAWVEEACGANFWNITALTGNLKYDAPNSTTANACTCSWASYNLLAGCTVCQGSIEFVTWGTWQMDCGDFVSTITYFPSDRGSAVSNQTATLSNETAIPFWAGTNPQTWTSVNFNATQAQAIQSQGHADLTGQPVSTTAPSKKSNTGAIVGGVVGGITAILLAILCITCLIVQRRRHFQPKPYPNRPDRPTMQHVHSMSDSSQKFLEPNGHGFPPGLQMQPYMTNGVPPVSHSMQSLPSTGPQPFSPASLIPGGIMPIYTGPGAASRGGVVTHAPIPPSSRAQGHMPSASVQSLGGAVSSLEFHAPPRGGPPPMPQTGLEDMISPFLSGQTSPRSANRKGNTPNTSHDFSEEGLPTAPTSSTSAPSSISQRTRMNPPAYTPAPGNNRTRTVARARGEKHVYGASADSALSNIVPEGNNPHGTDVETGLATYGSPLELSSSDMMWGGSTIAGNSELDGTIVGDDDRNARKNIPRYGQ